MAVLKPSPHSCTPCAGGQAMNPLFTASTRWSRVARRNRTQLPQRFLPEEAVVLKNQSDLDALQPGILEVLNPIFDAQDWSARVGLVLLADQTVAVFALADYVASDQADELLRQALARGYVMACPPRYILDAPLLLSVLRQPRSQAERRQPAPGQLARTTLNDAFQDLLEWGVRHGASDLHINIFSDQPESEVKYTIRGRYVAPARFR